VKKRLCSLIIFTILAFGVMLARPQAARAATTYTTAEEAGIYLRQQLKAKASSVTTLCQCDDWRSFGLEVFKYACTYTGDPMEGDYLRYTILSCTYKGTQKSTGVYSIAWTISYSLYAAQEQVLDVAFDALKEDLLSAYPLCGDYGVIRSCYEYIMENITYDDDTAHWTDDTHTPYFTWRYGYSSSKGIALFAYRLLTTMGIDCRIVNGRMYADGSVNSETPIESGNFWIMAKLDGLYYMIDPTLDMLLEQDSMFLMRGTADGAMAYHVFSDANYFTLEELETAEHDLPLDHIYTASDTIPATHHSKGMQTWTCSRCGGALEEETPMLKLEKASGLTATADVNGIALSWSAVTGADAYEVLVRESGDSGWQILSAGTTANACIHTSAENGVKYEYCVRAIAKNNEKIVNRAANSDLASFMLTLPLEAVTASVNGSTVHVSWTPAIGASDYEVQRKLNSEEWQTVTPSISIGESSVDFEETTLASGFYRYRVRIVWSGQELTWRSAYCESDQILLVQAPERVTASKTDTGTKVSWTPVSGAQGYQIQRSDNGGAWATIDPSVSSANGEFTFEETNLSSGTVYRYRVRTAWQNGNALSYSDYRKSGDVLVLHAPKSVSLTRTSTGFTVSFSAVTGATGYQIQRKVDGGSWKNLSVSFSEKDGNLTFENTGLASGSTYQYRVRAKAGSGDTAVYSSYRESASALMLLAPASVSATITATGLQVTFPAVNGADSYQVQRKVDDGSWKNLSVSFSEKDGNLTFENTGLTSGSTYQYRVCAKAGSGGQTISSSYRESAATLMLRTPYAVATTMISTGFKVTFSEVKGADRYQIQRRVNAGNWKAVTVTLTAADGKLTFEDTGLSSGSTYQYRICAVTGGENAVYGTYKESAAVLLLRAPSSISVKRHFMYGVFRCSPSN